MGPDCRLRGDSVPLHPRKEFLTKINEVIDREDEERMRRETEFARSLLFGAPRVSLRSFGEARQGFLTPAQLLQRTAFMQQQAPVPAATSGNNNGETRNSTFQSSSSFSSLQQQQQQPPNNVVTNNNNHCNTIRSDESQMNSLTRPRRNLLLHALPSPPSVQQQQQMRSGAPAPLTLVTTTISRSFASSFASLQDSIVSSHRATISSIQEMVRDIETSNQRLLQRQQELQRRHQQTVEHWKKELDTLRSSRSSI